MKKTLIDKFAIYAIAIALTCASSWIVLSLINSFVLWRWASIFSTGSGRLVWSVITFWMLVQMVQNRRDPA